MSNLIAFNKLFKYPFVLIGLISLFLTSCEIDKLDILTHLDDETSTSLEAFRRGLFMQSPSDKYPYAADAVPIAYYVDTDEGLIEYSLLDDNLKVKELSNIQGTFFESKEELLPSFASHLQARFLARQQAFQTAELTPQRWPTFCPYLEAANTGCHYLIESKAADAFNIVYLVVDLPSHELKGVF